jgi:hypothetical protein
MRRLAPDNPAYRRIMPKPLGVVHILLTSETPEYGLPQHANKRMPTVLAGAGVGERVACHREKTKRVVEFSIGEQTGVGGDDRAAKLHHQATVKIDSENIASRFTR